MREDFPASLLDRYEPARLLGVGGMGRVWLAHARDGGAAVALKLVRGEAAAAEAARLEREAVTLARVRHPNVVRLVEFGETPEGPFLAQEYVPGETLAALSPHPEALEVCRCVADGLAAVHDAGLLHRDVKPGNVILAEDGRAVLADFGLAFAPDLTALTGTGTAVGTFGFMAPELLEGRPASPATDLYALGATLFYALEGRPPMTRQQVLEAARKGAWPTPRFERTDPLDEAARLALALLSRIPEERPRSLESPSRGALIGLPPPEERGAPPGDDDDPTESVPQAELFTPEALSSSAPGEFAVARRGPSGATPPPRDVTWLALGGLALLALTGGLAAVIPLEPAGPESAAFGRALRAELEGASAELRDPARFGDLVAACPSLGQFHDWLGRGGHPEDLGPMPQAMLAELNEVGRGLGFPPPLSPFHDAGPSQDPAPLAPDFEADDPAGPPTLTGWLATAQREAQVALREAAALEAALAAHPPGQRYPGNLDPDLVTASLPPDRRDLEAFLAFAAARAEARPALAAWTRRGAEALAAALWACRRASAEDPAARPLAATIARVTAERAGMLMLGTHWPALQDLLLPAASDLEDEARARAAVARRFLAASNPGG